MAHSMGSSLFWCKLFKNFFLNRIYYYVIVVGTGPFLDASNCSNTYDYNSYSFTTKSTDLHQFESVRIVFMFLFYHSIVSFHLKKGRYLACKNTCTQWFGDLWHLAFSSNTS